MNYSIPNVTIDLQVNRTTLKLLSFIIFISLDCALRAFDSWKYFSRIERSSNDTYMNIELQRKGRNKNTVINHAYIESGEYRKKFDLISDNKKLNRLLYELSKKMLFHRTGTLYEDMYWIDIDTCQIIAKEVNCHSEYKVTYSNATKKVIKKVSTYNYHSLSSREQSAKFRRLKL